MQLSENIESLIEQLRNNVGSLAIKERQKILRILVKEIFVDKNEIKIRHSIPSVGKVPASHDKSYLLCWGSSFADFG